MIAEFHLRAWQRIPEVEIVALADPETGRAVKSRDTFYPTAEVFSDFGTMLRSCRIDFVDILTPPRLHRKQCLKAVERNLHIICQKPLCDRWEEADSLVRRLREYPRLFCVHENHPFRPWFLRVLQLKEEGFFGDLLELSFKQHDVQEPPENKGTLARGRKSVFQLFREGKMIENEIRCPARDYAESFFLFQRTFVDALLTGACPPSHASDNFQVLRTVFEAYAHPTAVRTNLSDPS